MASIICVATPSYLAQRTQYAKDGGSDLRQVAQTIHDNAHVNDAVVFDETVRPSRKPRLAADLYPDQITGLVNLQLVTPYWKRAGLWDRVAQLDSLGQPLGHQTVVWAVELRGSSSTDQIVLEKLGFTLERTIPVHRTVIYKFVKESPGTGYLSSSGPVANSPTSARSSGNYTMSHRMRRFWWWTTGTRCPTPPSPGGGP